MPSPVFAATRERSVAILRGHAGAALPDTRAASGMNALADGEAAKRRWRAGIVADRSVTSRIGTSPAATIDRLERRSRSLSLPTSRCRRQHPRHRRNCSRGRAGTHLRAWLEHCLRDPWRPRARGRGGEIPDVDLFRCCRSRNGWGRNVLDRSSCDPWATTYDDGNSFAELAAAAGVSLVGFVRRRQSAAGRGLRRITLVLYQLDA